MSSSTATSSPSPNPDSQFDFLLQILQVIYDSDGDPQVVYPRLQANLDKLDDNLAHLLRMAPVPAKTVAAVINIFGELIHHFPKGSKSSNLEIAIAAIETASQGFTREALPELWAENKTDLGYAYFDRIQGDQAENLEKAIAAFEAALQVYTLEAFPSEWANIQNYLGTAYLHTAYCHQIQGNRAKDLEQAIAAFEAARQVYTLEAFPKDWVMIQSNLATAYSIRINGDQAKNIEQAIGAHIAVLQVYTREAFPEQWANAQNNLGNSYCHRLQGNQAENLEQAISTIQSALQVYTREGFPEQWAGAKNNLGAAYRDQGQINKAIACFRSALEINTPTAFPLDCLQSGRNLGNTAFTSGHWAEAIEGYGVAIEGLEQSRFWASSDSRKEEILSAEIDVYAGIVQAYIKNDQPDKAIEYVERSKSRNLVELLANKNLYPKRNLYPNPEAFQTHKDQLDQLRRKIPAKQRELEIFISSRESQERYRHQIQQRRQELKHLQQQRDELLGEINQVDSSFTFTQKVEPIPFSDIQALTDENTAIVEWYITGSQILTFIITHHNLQPTVVPSSLEDMRALENWDKEYQNAYRQQKSQWITGLASRLQHLAEILHIDDILARIDEIFKQKGTKCDRLILISHRFLHLFPLHALPLANGDFLCDRFPNGVGYAPSCQLLQLTQKRERPDFSNFFAIQNPTDDLLYTNLEVETICSSFSSAQVLVKQAATKTALNASQDLPLAHCNHFSCHGEFNLTSPLESALLLANKERLTLGEIFGLNLNQCRLVTLSACETGLTDPTSISDEYIGLPSGFLYAGSPSVVSSLWTVNDLSTAFLMLKFYENFQSSQKQAGDVAVALNQAQQWLRNLTIEKLDCFLNEHKPQLDHVLAQLRSGQRMIFQESLKQIRQRQPLPFANPYYWAAFTATGL